MDREACILIYSEYSSASKKIFEYISSLSYDVIAITGMVLLKADTQQVRDSLVKMNIKSVPCIYVKYFDGRSSLYEDEDVYEFIRAISRAINSTDAIRDVQAQGAQAQGSQAQGSQAQGAQAQGSQAQGAQAQGAQAQGSQDLPNITIDNDGDAANVVTNVGASSINLAGLNASLNAAGGKSTADDDNTIKIVSKADVMNTAMELHKSREKALEKIQVPPIVRPVEGSEQSIIKKRKRTSLM